MKVTDPLTDHLPQLESMICAIEAGQHGELFKDFAELDLRFGALYGTYIEELQYLAADDPQNAIVARIGEKFLEVRPLIGALRDDLSLHEYSAALATLFELRDETVALYALFAEYKSIIQRAPKLSEIPYTHELLRVTGHYLEGKLSLEAVQGRLENFCHYHEALEAQISTLIPSPPERAAFEEHADELYEAINLQLQSIEDLDFALERNDAAAIREALDSLSEAAEVLVEIYRAMQSADLEPPTISCIRCGAKNSTDMRICGECAAVLPQSAASMGPTSTIAFEEDGTSVGVQHSEEILKLQSAVDLYLHEGQSHDLQRELESFEKRLERNRQQFERLDKPPADLPLEHRERLQSSRSIFASALGALGEGVELLYEGSRLSDALLLERGMDKMREGNALFADFQQEFQKAQELT